MTPQEIIWWHFFEQLKDKLGYHPSIQKYELLSKTIAKGFIPFENDFESFLSFCKILLLQNHQDEEQFKSILLAAFSKEMNSRITRIEKSLGIKLKEQPVEKSPKRPTVSPPPNVGKTQPIGEKPIPELIKKKSKKEKQEIIKYFHPDIDIKPITPETQTPVDQKSKRYLLSNDYLPFSSRQMEKGWQYYRRKELEGFTNQLDIPATIQEIAKKGFFLTPKYLSGSRNRKDTLIILADFRGSMVPFHEIVRELIRTAKEGGGHTKVAIYYFRNIPQRAVFKYANLSHPVRLEKVFAQCNHNYTKAIIISDAGAARMRAKIESINYRVAATEQFLKILNTAVSKAIWVNPMPHHRWTKTAAEPIAKMVKMIPVLETDNRLFLNAFKELS